MAFLKKAKAGGTMDEIRCDEPSYLIWKWHPYGSQAGANRRENAIRWGSSLRVKDGEVAVFVYGQNNGVLEDFIEGPYDQILETNNLPVLASILGLVYQGGTPFQAEVYFINLAKIIQIPFAVPYFDLYDPRFLDFGVPTAVRGKITFNIADYREFIKLHRLSTFDLSTFQSQVRDAISRYVKDVVANIPTGKNIPVVQIERAIGIVNDAVEESTRERFERDFGVNILAVDISAIDVDKTSEGYKQLKTVTQDLATAKVQAETTDYVERLRIQREEGQYAMHKQAQSTNIGAFQIEKQADVGIASANALGNISENDAGSVSLGNAGAGFNPAAMMAEAVVGGAVGKNIANTMNGMMIGGTSPSTATPPPVPKTTYNVVVDGISTGPYDKDSLVQMARNGKLNSSSLLWRPGMESWNTLENIPELKNILEAVPPKVG